MMPLALAVTEWAQLATTVAAFLGLLAVAFQLRAAAFAVSRELEAASEEVRALRNATSKSAYQAFASLMVNVDQTMIEHPRLRACIYANAQPSAEPDFEQQAEGTAEMFVDVADLVFQLRDVMPDSTAESWFAHFRELAENSDLLRDFVERFWKSYPLEMIEELFPWVLETQAPPDEELVF
jgi:hypothetical protein